MFPKKKYKKNTSKSRHYFTQAIKHIEWEDAKGLCRICKSEPITQYHHLNEKGMGGGRGLGIQINCLGIGDRCHNHDNIEFLHKCDKILQSRIDELFKEDWIFGQYEVAEKLDMDPEELYRQLQKGFLIPTYPVPLVYTTDDIRRWLGYYTKETGVSA